MPRLVLSLIFMLLCLFPANARKKNEKLPDWISFPYSKYSEDEYIVELGSGSSQKEADNKAIEGMAAIFNRSVSSKTDSSLSYNENSSSVDKAKSINQKILVETSIKDLIGVEIKERWKSKEGSFYALAVLNRQKAIRIYSEKIEHCISLIDNVLNIQSDKKGTFQEYSSYVFATSKANEISIYNTYLAVLNPASSMLYNEDTYKPEILRLKTINIAKNILVNVKFESNWIDVGLKSVFEKVFTSRNFTLAKTNNGRYTLNVNLKLGQESKLSDDRIMLRYSLTSNLIDNVTGDTFLPFMINDKAVHFDSDGLKNQIFKTIKTKIEKDFDAGFDKFMFKILISD